MKLGLLTFVVMNAVALATPVQRLSDFELTDQDTKTRSYRFPKTKVTVMTVADRTGSDELGPWIQRLHGRYEKRIDIDGVADVSMIPKPFHNIFREAFRKQLTYSVMLDWEGSVVQQFGYTKRAANLYVIDRRGRIVKHVVGPLSEAGMRELTSEIDRTIAEALP